MFFTPRYLKEAKHYLHAAKKVRNYRRDILSSENLGELDGAIASLKAAIGKRERVAVDSAMGALDGLLGELAPTPPDAGWREQVEVFLVAIVIAAGVRAYFLQPFRIPTGSMQPTLFGVVGEPSDGPGPNPLSRVFQVVVQGRNWIDVVAKSDDVVIDVTEKTYLNFFIFSTISCEKNTYQVFSPKAPLASDFHISKGRKFDKGEIIARGFINTGDQVFVDKMSYHFVKPQLADVFVFKTTGIRLIQQSLPKGVESQYYIKRLAGRPGDILRIDQPNLYIDNALAQQAPFKRVMSLENGYRGYSNAPSAFMYLGSPQASFPIPPRSYFALGDNSDNSLDSRYWGIVPQANVAGKGLIVYWPFTSRWGLIR